MSKIQREFVKDQNTKLIVQVLGTSCLLLNLELGIFTKFEI